MNGLRPILLVEDDERDVELTLIALRDLNIANEVQVARDGEEALDYLHRRNAYASESGGRPIVILLDLKMPKVDGLEVLRDIKATKALKSIPVVVLTSSREERDLVESYELGVNAYVVKPMDFDQFLEAIRRLSLFWAVMNEIPAPANERESEGRS